MNKVKTALIGYGHLGKWHAQKAEQLESCDFIAIVERNSEKKKLAQEAYPHVKVVDDLSGIMDEIDAALIVTPTSFHFEIAKILLENRKNVFCEKPVTETYEQALELKKLASLHKNFLQVGHSERFHSIWEKRTSTFKDFFQSPSFIKMTRVAPFKGRATDVDVVHDLMIHDLDLLLYLFEQRPISVFANGAKVRTKFNDIVSAHFEFENGMCAIIEVGRNNIQEVRSVEIVNDQGVLNINLMNNEVKLANALSENVNTLETYTKRDHLLEEQKLFYDGIINHKSPVIGINDGVNALYLIEKVMESLNKKERINIEINE